MNTLDAAVHDLVLANRAGGKSSMPNAAHMVYSTSQTDEIVRISAERASVKI